MAAGGAKLKYCRYVGTSFDTNVGKVYTLEAGGEIKLTVGKASLVMKADGTITFNGQLQPLAGLYEPPFVAAGAVCLPPRSKGGARKAGDMSGGRHAAPVASPETATAQAHPYTD